MNRKEFMERLEALLGVIPEEERREALQFYTDYFEDAGEENEARVIEELVSPEKVAAVIRTDLAGDGDDSGEFTENGYSDSRFEQRADPVPRPNRYKRAEGGYTYHSTEGQQSYRSSSYGNDSYDPNGGYSEPPRTSRILKIVLVILIALAVASFAWPVLLAAAGIVIGLVCAAIGLFAGLVLGGVALIIVGIVIFVLGLTKLLAAFPVALLTSGSGLLIFILGLILTVAAVKLCIVVYPAIFRGIVNIFRWPLHHRKAVS